MEIEERKSKHIEVCLNQNVETGSTFFEHMRLIPKALPEIGMKDVDTSIDFLKKKLKIPLIISGMTGGTAKGKEINKGLAAIAQKYGLGMGVGSQRAMIENEKLIETFQIRDVAPDILLFGNIGATQAREYSSQEIKGMIDSIGADALCIHINPAQETFQEKGDTDYEHCLHAIKRIVKEIPVIVKGVGQGFERESALKIHSAGASAIDIGGQGGTNWIKIDSLISGKNSQTFENWGIPTACSLLECKKTIPIIASGGLRTGTDMAKSIALGADMCGMALPFLKAWNENKLDVFVQKVQNDFKKIMYLCGCKKVSEMKKAEYALFGKLYEYSNQRVKKY